MPTSPKINSRLLARLTDEDHRVNAALQLGGVTKVLTKRRGTLTESFLCDGQDVTQSVTRLERAGLVDTNQLKWNINEDVQTLLVNKYRNARGVNPYPCRSKP